MTIFKKLVLIGALSLAALFLNLAEKTVLAQRGYGSGGVVVKFREGINPKTVIEELDLEVEDIQRIYSVDEAITKYQKYHRIAKREPDGTYWFRGRSYERLEDIRKQDLFEEAYVYMDPHERSLYRLYVIKLSERMNLQEVLSQLRDHHGVEYVKPNW